MVAKRTPNGERPRGQACRLSPRVRVLWLTTTLLAITMLVSCSTPTVFPQTGAHATPSNPRSTPTQPITFWHPAPSLTLAQAWGNVKITKLPDELPNGEVFAGGNWATPDGQWLIGEIEPRDMLTNQTIYPQIALYNVNTSQIRVIRTLRSPQSRIDGASSDGRWLAWSDAVDPGSFFDWVMYICDLQTGSVRVLAQAPHDSGQAVQGPHAGPFVSNGYVVWSQPTAPVVQGDLNSLKSVVVQKEEISSRAVTTLANASSAMSFSWPWVAWGQISSSGQGSVELQNLVTQKRQQLNDEPDALSLDGSSAVVEDNNNEVKLITDLAHSVNTQTLFATDPSKYIQLGYPSITGRLVAWQGDASDPTPVVWDRMQHVTVVLPTTNVPQAAEAWTSGTLLIWYDPEPVAKQKADEAQGLSPLETYCIVNTAQLPTTAPGS